MKSEEIKIYEDYINYGECFYTQDKDGNKVRFDPSKIKAPFVLDHALTEKEIIALHKPTLLDKIKGLLKCFSKKKL